jgi:hypothetical protein
VRGYASANANGLLIANHVKSFECDNAGACNNLLPLTTYYFADANDGSHGGASFTADANGAGPNDSANWSAANYFGGAYTYFTGRMTTGSSSTAWGLGPNIDQGFGNCCNTIVGESTAVDGTRWNSVGDYIGNSHPIICMVHP